MDKINFSISKHNILSLICLPNLHLMCQDTDFREVREYRVKMAYITKMQYCVLGNKNVFFVIPSIQLHPLSLNNKPSIIKFPKVYKMFFRYFKIIFPLFLDFARHLKIYKNLQNASLFICYVLFCFQFRF